MRLSLVRLIFKCIEVRYHFQLRSFLSRINEQYGHSGIDGADLVIIDVGANKGEIIKLISTIFSEAKIVAYEPLNDLATELSMRFKNVNVFCLALSNFSGSSAFIRNIMSETSSLIPTYKNSRWSEVKRKILGVTEKEMAKEIEVSVDTLDNQAKINCFKRINFLKIDVEGAELEVLLGARNLLEKRLIDFIMFENHKGDLRPSSYNEISNLLNTYGYRHILTLKHIFGVVSDEIFMC